MDVAWYPPTLDYVKINSHCISVEQPLPNGNHCSVGVLIRDAAGNMLWVGMGPIPSNDQLETELKGIHVALVKAIQLNRRKTHMETDSIVVHEAIRDQDEVIFDEAVEVVLRQINSVHVNHFIEGETD